MQLLAYLTVTPTPIPGSLAYDWEYNRLGVICIVGIILSVLLIILGLCWGLKSGFSSGRSNTRIVYVYRVGGRRRKRNYHTCVNRRNKRRRY